MNTLGRWWAGLTGAPLRAFARRLASRLPRASYDGIDLLIGDPRLAGDAERFFTRTKEALRYAETHAPGAYTRLREDLSSIVLRREQRDAPYHRFQRAALVPVAVGLEADAATYAAWLLYTSGLSRGTAEADDRASELISTLRSDQREDVRARLPPSTP